MSKANLVLAVLFVLLVFIVNADEYDSLENASVSNESNVPISTATGTNTNEQVYTASSSINATIINATINATDASTVVSEDNQPSLESNEPSLNVERQSQTSEEKAVKAVTASFGVYLQIVS